MIVNFIVGGIILIIFAAAILYIVRAKKKGVKCIGCAAGKNCSSSGCGCS